MAHRNPNAKPVTRPKTGNERRGNANAQEQARQNLNRTVDIVKESISQIPKAISKVKEQGGSSTSTPSVTMPIVPNRGIPQVPKENVNGFNVSNVKKGFTNFRNGLASGKVYSFNPYEQSIKDRETAEEYRRKEKWRKKHTLEGQIETEIDKVTTSGRNTKRYDMYSSLLNDYWNDYVYNVDREEFQKWYNDNVIEVDRYNMETGQREKTTTFKPDAPPPPLGTDKDGNVIDITKAWRYCQAYDVAINKYLDEEYEKQLKGTATKVAGQDESAVDSLLDVIRAGLNPEMSGTEALKSYAKDYFINPLMNGDFKELGINTLWNVGEALDYAGVGVRAVGASNDAIGSFTNEPTFEGQEKWWYDEEHHSEQNRLVALGVDKILRGTAKHEGAYNTGGDQHHRYGDHDTVEAIEQRIKDAGLWDEYQDMKTAWGEHQQSYREDNKLLNSVKSAYTDPAANFHADTGNVVKDIAIETVLDPTLVLGGAAKGFAKTTARSTSEIAARSITKRFASVTVSQEGAKSAEAALKQFIKNNADNLLTKNHDQIAEEIKHLGDQLESAGAISQRGAKVDANGHWTSFDDELSKEIFGSIDSLNYKVVRSLHNASEVMDKVDSTLLKSVFAVPYLPISGAVKGYRGARNELFRLAETAQKRNKLFGEEITGLDKLIVDGVDRMAKRNTIDEIVAKNQFGKMQSASRLPKTVTIADIERTYDAMKRQPSSEIWDEADKFIQSAKDLSSAMNKSLADFREGKITAAQYHEAVDAQIQTFSGGFSTRSELKAHLEDLFKNAPEGDRGRLGEVYNNLIKQIDQVETIEKQLLDREVADFTKELDKINDINKLMEFSERYFIRNAEQALPEAFENALLAKQAELGGKISPEEFEIIRNNLERHMNFSTDLNPRDADIPLPVSVRESDKFGTIIPVEIMNDVENLQKYFTKEEHDWHGLYQVRQFMFSIGKVEDMPPKALHDVLRKGIVELMLRKNMGAIIDDQLYATMISIDKQLYENALSIDNVLGRSVEFNALHLDHLTVFDEYMKHPKFKKVLDTLRDPNTAIGKALRDTKDMHLSSVDYEGNPAYELMMQINDLLDMNNAYFEFRNAISDEVAGLTDRQVYAVLDRLFGITKGSPKDYLNKALAKPEQFTDDLETLLVAEYGETRCSLDGARTQIQELDKELFKRFEKELDEKPELIDRMKEITSPGHIDPMNDVRVQMLYTILKDDTTIRDYNHLQKNEREVIFSDIETSGLNRDRNGLTSIAFKKWKPLDEKASLSDILDAIEDSSTETLLKRSLSEEELRRIDDGLLNSLYAKNPKLANTDRATKLEDYKKFYCEEANGTTIFDTEEDMMKFINQYITDASVTKSYEGWFGEFLKRTRIENRGVPCLVFHNTNGFDTKFLTSRMRNLNVGIPKGAVEHLTDLEAYSHNTLARLRALEGDVVLTYEQKQFVQDQVVRLARNIEHLNDGFKFLDPRALEMALYDLSKITNPAEFQKIAKNAEDRRLVSKTVDVPNGDLAAAEEALREAEYDAFLESVRDVQRNENTVKPSKISIDQYPKDSLQTKLGLPNTDKYNADIQEILDSGELRLLRQDLKTACQDVGHMQNRYEKNIIQKLGRMNDDFSTAKTYSNLMREAQELVPDRPWSYLSYDVMFRSSDSASYFDWNLAEKMTADDLHNMKQFTDWINNQMQYNLLAGADEIIEPYEDFFRATIETAQHFVTDVSSFNEFSYLRFLKQPSTPMEAFLMAKKLYDDVLKYTDTSQFMGDAELFNAHAADYLNGNSVDQEFKKFIQIKTMQDLGMVADNFDVSNLDAMNILSGKSYAGYIFRDTLADTSHYIDSLKTPEQQAVSELKELRTKIRTRSKSMIRQSALMMSSEFAQLKTVRVQNAYNHLNDLIKKLEKFEGNILDEEAHNFWNAYIHFKKTLNVKRMELFDAYRLNRMLRDAEGNLASDEQLISEILFSNGMRKVIPRTGTDLHVKQVQELIDRIETMETGHLVLHQEGDHIVITVDPEFKPLINTEAGETIIRFPDSSVDYRMLPEDKLAFPEFDDIMKEYDGKIPDELQEVYEDLKHVYDDIDELTEGASRGTLGIMASYGKEAKLAGSFSAKNIRNSLKLDYTGDQRLWNYTSFDKSLLGDFDNSWKLSSNADDFDLVQNAANVLDEASGRMMSERHYIDTFFGKDSPCKLSSIAGDFSNRELMDMFRNSDEYVCVTLGAANTHTGFEVRQLKFNDELSVEIAKQSDAIYVPYDLYITMTDIINNAEISSKFLKLWTKFVTALKVTQLVHPGTFIRNWIDATYKIAGDEGSLAMALQYEFIAAKRLMDAQKIFRQVGTDVTEATWKASNFDKYMTYDDFRDLVGFMANDSVSGGESTRSKKILHEFFIRGRKDEALGLNGFDTIGKDVQRFEQAFDGDKLENAIRKTLISDPELFSKMEQEDFINLFNARTLDINYRFTDDATEWLYNEIAQKVIKTASDDTITASMRLKNSFDKVTGKMLTPMSQTELMVRYSQLLALRDLGYTNASAYKHIIETHFNYNNKTMRMKCLEAVVPFATFQYNNLLYWIKQIDNNPRMIRWIERTFGALSFQGIDDVQDDRNGFIDQSLEYRIASGGIPLGSGGLYLKLNPSYLDALNWFYGGPADFLDKVSPPIRSLAKAGVEELGLDSYNLFSDVQFSHSASEWAYELSESVPVANLVSGYVRHFKDTQNWNRVDLPWHKALVFAMPSLFGATKTYKQSYNQDFDEWQKDLEKQGKWYDAEKGKVVDISEKNEYGLNDPDLSFEDRRILELLFKGRLYDQNQGRFVSREYFIEGGLNRDWDFSKEGEWEEYCKLKKEYLGLEYDFNLRKFVKYKTPGGLNQDNLDWDTVCDLNQKKGLYWDSNQGRFVKPRLKDGKIVGYVFGGLNKEHMSFPELCAYQYALKGKIWDKASHQFVETGNGPLVVSKASNPYNDWRIFNNLGFNPMNITSDNATYMEDGMLRTIDGKYVLSDNVESNQRIFDELVKKYSYGGFSRRFGYHKGWGGGNYYDKTPIVPNRPYRNILTVKNRPFGFTYSSSDDYAALRMAVSGYKAYDDYYKFEFGFNYSYRNPTGLMNTVKRFDYYRPDHRMISDKFAFYKH